MASILIRGGLLFDGDALSRKDIFAKDGKISEIADEIDREADFVCEASSQLVTPGLVDIHAHLRGLAPTAFGFPAELATLPFGVTAACDAGSSLGSRETLEALPIGAVSLVAYSGDGERDDARLAAYGERAIGIKVYFDTDLSPSVNAAYLEGACAYARERGLTVMVHCSNSPIPMSEIVTMLAPGDILTHTYHGGRHTAEEGDFAALRSAKEKGVLVDAGMAGHVHTDFGVLARCLAAGLAPDTIGSDITNFSAYTRGGRYGLTMCMSIARRLGMSETALLRAVTSTSARAVGKGEAWGTLAVGRRADLAVLSYCDEGFSLTDRTGNHIESNQGYRCLLTVLGGQVVYRH